MAEEASTIGAKGSGGDTENKRWLTFKKEEKKITTPLLQLGRMA